MASSNFVYLLCPLLTHFLALTLAQQPARPVMLYKDCVGKGNYTTNSTYQANLNYLLNSIHTNNDINYGFYNFSYGDNPDTVYAIALCRPDVTPEICRDCVRNASDSLTANCPNFKEAIGGLDDCMVRYANRPIFRLMELGPYFWVYSQDNVSDVTGFNLSRITLLDRLRDQAAMGDSRYKYAMGNITAPNFQTLYALVQCTPDLTESDCRDCLYSASGLIPQCCLNRGGGRVIYPSCNFRYEINPFYGDVPSNAPPPLQSTSNPPPPQSTSPPNGTYDDPKLARTGIYCLLLEIDSLVFSGKKTRTLIIIVVTVVTAITLVKEETAEHRIEGVESLQIDTETLRKATDNFAAANKLGQGGFGAVYKGMLPNGKSVAVKRLPQGSGQREVEFGNEILLVAKLQHRNLVKLLGFCCEKEERILVYEFLSNSSLNNFIFDPIKRAFLDWGTRYKIIEGVARGLLYLHEKSRLRIIHRDLKASNILLDDEMNPKISDFGLSRLFAVDQTRDETNTLAGTFGYMAPEYVARRRFSVKSDVFSFGVLVLEIVSGQRNSSFRMGEEEEEEEGLLTYAWRNWNQGTSLNLVDPNIKASSQCETTRCIHIGLLCVQGNEADRPTMVQVVTMLSSHSITLPGPFKPAFFGQRGSHCSRTTESEEKRGKSSINEVTISEVYPR